MYQKLKYFIAVSLLLLQYHAAFGQVEREHLKPLLSASDQRKIEKIDALLQKAKNIENEANTFLKTGSSDKEKAKAEKKYTMKRLEAAEHYQKANAALLGVLKDNINDFRKKNKKLPVASIIRNKEDKAGELQRSARALRKVAEDLVYPQEKLPKILEAEAHEKESAQTYVKVLYAYLNQPIAYDVLKDDTKPVAPVAAAPKADTVKTMPPVAVAKPVPVDTVKAAKPALPETRNEPAMPKQQPATSEKPAENIMIAAAAPPVVAPAPVAAADIPVPAKTSEPEKSTQQAVSKTGTTAVNTTPSQAVASTGNLVFKIQLVASKTPLSKEAIRKIYPGSRPVEEKLEAGWYKYSIVAGPVFGEAKSIMEKEKLQGAFITAYLDDKRIDMKQAISMSK